MKALDDIDSLSGLVSWTVVPNFRALGPRLGARVNEVKTALAAADGGELQAALERDGFVEIAGERITADEVEVRADRHQDVRARARTARGRSRSISSSTTTCGRRAPHARSCAR